MDDRNFINAWDIKSKREEYFKETFDSLTKEQKAKGF